MRQIDPRVKKYNGLDEPLIAFWDELDMLRAVAEIGECEGGAKASPDTNVRVLDALVQASRRIVKVWPAYEEIIVDHFERQAASAGAAG